MRHRAPRRYALTEGAIEMDLSRWAFDVQVSQRVMREEIYGVNRRRTAPARWLMALLGL